MITDLDGAMVEVDWISSEDVFVHRGFDSEYDRFRDTMLEIINDNNPSKIILSGHSLGSALATLSALDLSMNYGYDVSLVSMGGPRVGNKEYRELMDNYVKIPSAESRNEKLLEYVNEKFNKVFMKSVSNKAIYSLCWV